MIVELKKLARWYYNYPKKS